MLSEKFIETNVLIIGDLILDEYWHGHSDRISPEAPVPVVKLDKKEYRIGGAGNVALNIVSLNSNAHLISHIGNDRDGNLIKNLLKKNKIKSTLNLTKNLKTIKKTRVVSNKQQMIRLDFEDKKENYSIKFDNKIKLAIKKSKLIIISDYNKGSLDCLEEIIKFAVKEKKIIVVDPLGDDFRKYKNSTILTPNLKEFTNIVGEFTGLKDFLAKARSMIRELNLKALLVTRGDKGMILVEKKSYYEIPANIVEVSDVSGAGDTVSACMALGLASNLSLRESSYISNLAASIAVGKSGTSPVKFNELSAALNKVYNNISESKNLNNKILFNKFLKNIKPHKKIIMTNGCFDILHVGHIEYLKKAKKLGDLLVVAINSDASVRNLKGKGRPINSLKNRMNVLQSLYFVDYIISFKEKTPIKIINEISPDILVKGGDYKIKDIAGAKYVKSYGGKVILIELIKGMSSSKIIKSIKNSI